MTYQGQQWTIINSLHLRVTINKVFYWWVQGWMITSHKMICQHHRLDWWLIMRLLLHRRVRHLYRIIIMIRVVIILLVVCHCCMWEIYHYRLRILFEKDQEKRQFHIFSHWRVRLLIIWTTPMGICMGRDWEIDYRKSLDNWHRKGYWW